MSQLKKREVTLPPSFSSVGALSRLGDAYPLW